MAAKAPASELPIASTTKLMTAYLALERLPLTKRVPMAAYTPTSPSESLLGVPAGRKISVRDLLYGLILRSGNDAAMTLARAVAGTPQRFVLQMNRTAGALGLADSHYENPVGLDAPGNHSSARDLAALGTELLHEPSFAQIAASRHAVLRSLKPPLSVGTRNTLLASHRWVNGIKTGHTLGAGYVLVASARRKGVELVSAVLGAPAAGDRDSDSLGLLDYGFSLSRTGHPVRAGEQFADPGVRYAGGRLGLVAARAVRVGVRAGQHLGLAVNAPTEVSGPIKAGAMLGRLTVTVDGRKAAVVPLLAAASIPRASTLQRLGSDEVPIAISAAAFVIVIALVGSRRRRGRPTSEEEMRASREQRQRIRQERQRVGGAKK